MSKSVVTAAAAAAHAKRVEKGRKLAKQQESQQSAADEAQAAGQEEDAAKAVQTESELQNQTSMSDGALGGFSFAGALATAAVSTASLTSEVAVQADGGGSDDDADGSGTILLIGAIGLVGAGVAVLASGGGGSDAPPANAPPVLAAIAAQATDEDTAVTFSASATDPNGDTLTFSGTSPNGTVAVSGSSITFTPALNFNGAATVTVSVADGKGGTDSETVTVNVAPVNDAPVPSANNTTSITTLEDTPAEFFIDFTDVDDPESSLVVELITAPTKGTFSEDGTQYVPNDNANGADSFTYRVLDKNGGAGFAASAPVTVSVTITPVNDAPVLAAITDKTTANDAALTFAVTASDVDGDALTFTVGDAVNGTAAVSNGQVTFTPTADFTGAGSLLVTVSDGTLTDTQTVAITITAAGTGGGGGGTGTVVDIDVGLPSSPTPVSLSGAGGSFIFEDEGDKNTHVFITGFADDDRLSFLNGTVSDYSFGTSATDQNDLVMTRTNNDGTANIIILDNVLTGGFIVDYDTAVASVGFDFAGPLDIGGGGNGGGGNGGGGGTPTDVTIDVGLPSSQTPVTVSAAGGAFNFLENADANTHVFITGFGNDDQIVVSNAAISEYSFGTASGDPNDLLITLTNNDGTANIIILDNVLNGPVFGGYANAVASVGFDFMTIA